MKKDNYHLFKKNNEIIIEDKVLKDYFLKWKKIIKNNPGIKNDTFFVATKNLNWYNYFMIGE